MKEKSWNLIYLDTTQVYANPIVPSLIITVNANRRKELKIPSHGKHVRKATICAF
jgi:hypothetical protein